MIAKLWRGDYSLVVTYWVFGVVVGVVLNAALTASARTLPVAVYFAFLAAVLAYSILVWVGIWRAATKYQGDRIWPTLAKCMVVAAVLMLIWGLVTG